MKYIFAIAIFAATTICIGAPPSQDIYSSDFWLIPGPSDNYTWIEIHDRKNAQKTDIAHIFVLSRKKTDPVYAIKRLYSHIAITTEALQRSVIRPYKTKWTYPEVFYESYDRWKKSADREICSTSIQEFLKTHGNDTEQGAAANP